MTDNELLRFNPLIAKALAQFKSENHAQVTAMMREITIAALKTGAAPEMIHAMPKNGRMLTRENMKFLSNADLREWADAAAEYKARAGR